MVISYFKFLVFMVTLFWPKCNKCSKMRSKCRISANLRVRVSVFSELKQLIKLKEIPRNGVDRCIEIAPSDLVTLLLLI